MAFFYFLGLLVLTISIEHGVGEHFGWWALGVGFGLGVIADWMAHVGGER
jgi:4-amino-4-deoxy-L-arabinose transferase-like glycosyltransferase